MFTMRSPFFLIQILAMYSGMGFRIMLGEDTGFEPGIAEQELFLSASWFK
jgi:hypothetical protein